METEIKSKFIEHILLQHKLNSIIDPNWYKNLKVIDYNRAFKSELFEAYDSIPWQWWKKAEFDFYNFKIELIDAYHFMLSSIILISNIIRNQNIFNNLKLLLSDNIDNEQVKKLKLRYFELYNIDIGYLKNVEETIRENFINADKIKLFMYDETSFIKHSENNLLFNNPSDIDFNMILEILDKIISELGFQTKELDIFILVDQFIRLCAITMTFYEFDLLYRIKNRINQLRQQKQYKETLKARLLNDKDDNEFIIDLLYKNQIVKSYQDFEKILEQVL